VVITLIVCKRPHPPHEILVAFAGNRIQDAGYMKLKPKTVEIDYSITFKEPFLHFGEDGLTIIVDIEELVDDGDEGNQLLVSWEEVVDFCEGSVIDLEDFDVIIENFKTVADRLEEIKKRHWDLYNKSLASRSTT